MQESGVPNVTGQVGGDHGNRSWGFANAPIYQGSGCIQGYNTGESLDYPGNNRNYYFNGFNIDNNRISSEYQSINEVRVKSIISNGYIKLY